MFLHEVATREINESEEINIALIVECFNQEIYTIGKILADCA